MKFELGEGGGSTSRKSLMKTYLLAVKLKRGRKTSNQLPQKNFISNFRFFGKIRRRVRAHQTVTLQPVRAPQHINPAAETTLHLNRRQSTLSHLQRLSPLKLDDILPGTALRDLLRQSGRQSGRSRCQRPVSIFHVFLIKDNNNHSACPCLSLVQKKKGSHSHTHIMTEP